MTRERLFKIGRLWLIGDAILFGCIGLILAIDPDNLLFHFWNKGYETHFQPVTHAQRDFLAGPLGGTILGSYVMTGFIAAIPLGQRQRWAWWALLLSLLAWLLLDSSMTAMHGAWFNLVQINLIAMLLQGIPLGMTAPEVFNSSKVTPT